MRELLIADVDGTIVRNDILEDHPEYDMPSPRAIEAVRRMHEEERLLSPATSRTPRMMGQVASALNLYEIGVLNGGATIFDFGSGERVHGLSRELSSAQVTRIVRAIGGYCTQIFYREELGPRTPDTINLGEISPEGAASVFAIYLNAYAAAIDDELANIDGLSFHPNRYENTTTHSCVQVVREGVGKKSGVELLRHSEGYIPYYSQLRDDDIAIIGDGWNDIELFQAIPGALKIAMGNADKSLKEHADVIVPPAHEDGFAYAIENYIM
jgi:hydroxymethylpyrimidine pyrophosphatase-like HAD family hydrolase